MDESRAAISRPGESERLLARHLAGDSGAFGAVARLYEERLFVLLERLTGNAGKAEKAFLQRRET